MLGMNFKDAGKEDLVHVIAKIEARQDFSDWTKCDYKLILKLFYQWLYGCERCDYSLELTKLRF
jgi:hypothetical protein